MLACMHRHPHLLKMCAHILIANINIWKLYFISDRRKKVQPLLFGFSHCICSVRYETLPDPLMAHNILHCIYMMVAHTVSEIALQRAICLCSYTVPMTTLVLQIWLILVLRVVQLFVRTV